MPSRIPEELRRAIGKLHQARFHLEHLKSEVRKPEIELVAVEAYLSGCVGAVQGAFYVLSNTHPQFKPVQKAWRGGLSQETREFFNRMIGERDADVHAGRTSMAFHFGLQGPVKTAEGYTLRVKDTRNRDSA